MYRTIEMSKKKWNINTDTTRTYTYVLPMIGGTYKDYDEVFQYFIGDEDKPDYDRHIFLLCKNNMSDETKSFLESHLHFVESYTADDYHTMYVIKIPEVWLDSYNHFKNGQYSKIDELCKRQIIKFHGLKRNGAVCKVLYRTESLYKEWEERLGVEIDRMQEIGSMPDMKYEVYNEEKKSYKSDLEDLTSLWKKED